MTMKPKFCERCGSLWMSMEGCTNPSCPFPANGNTGYIPFDTTIDKETQRDNNYSWDYVAEIINPSVYLDMSRENLAKLCMEAAFEQDMQKFHAKGAYILEQMAIRLMGIPWCRNYLETNVFPKQLGDIE